MDLPSWVPAQAHQSTEASCALTWPLPLAGRHHRLGHPLLQVPKTPFSKYIMIDSQTSKRKTQMQEFFKQEIDLLSSQGQYRKSSK